MSGVSIALAPSPPPTYTAPVAVASDPRSKARAWSTPRILRWQLAAIVVVTAILFSVALGALVRERSALQTIGHDAAPSIVAALEIGVQLADLDAQLASSLVGTVAQRDVAQELFELRRSSATKRLVDAASNITYGDSERLPILTMSEDLGRYLELAAQAQWLFDRGDREAALSLFRVATNSMHGRILPNADALDRANRGPLDAAYESARSASWLSQVEALVVGAVLVGLLVTVQLFVRRRMRRRLAPALLAATVLVGLFTLHVSGRIGQAREDLRVARDDAFNSIHLLSRARAVAYDARGDETRWLLDRSRATFYETEFRTKLRVLDSRPDTAASRADVDSGRVTGVLAEEVKNVTFAGELEGANAVLGALANYYRADTRMRESERQGSHQDAVETCVGGRDDGALALFDRLDEGLQRTVAVNDDAFTQVLASADRGLARAEWIDPIVAIAIALLGWLGLRARIREYA